MNIWFYPGGLFLCSCSYRTGPYVSTFPLECSKYLQMKVFGPLYRKQVSQIIQLNSTMLIKPFWLERALMASMNVCFSFSSKCLGFKVLVKLCFQRRTLPPQCDGYCPLQKKPFIILSPPCLPSTTATPCITLHMRWQGKVAKSCSTDTVVCMKTWFNSLSWRMPI